MNFDDFVRKRGSDPANLDEATLQSLQAQFAEIMGNSQESPAPAAAPASAPAPAAPVEEPAKPAASTMMNRVRGIASSKKPTYQAFTDLVQKYGDDDDKISMSERRAMRKELGLGRKQMRQIAKGLNGGDSTALNKFVNNGLEKRSYVADGKLVTEGQDGWTEDAFNNATYKGTDVKALTDQYNKAVMDWRNKKDNISYDAATGEYWAEGFNGGNRVNVTNSDWAQAQRNAARNSWFEANKNNISYDPNTQGYLFNGTAMKDSSWLDQNYTNNLQAKAYGNEVNSLATNADQMNAWASTYNKGNMNKVLGITDEEAKADNYSETYHNALTEHLKGIAMDPTKGSVQADALLQYLTSQGLNSMGNKNAVTYAPGSRMFRAQQALNPRTDRYSFKNGGSFTKARAYKNGGNLKKYQEGGDLASTAAEVGKRMIPIYGTYLDWKDAIKDPSLMNIGSAALSTLGDATLLFGGSALKGVSAAMKAGKAAKNMATAGKTLATAKKGTNAYRAAQATMGASKATLKGAGKALTNGSTLTRTAASDAWKLGKSAITRAGFRAPAAINHWVNPVQEQEATQPTEPNVQPGSVYSGYQASAPVQPTQPTNLDYSLNSNEFYRKNGGTLNMEKINYFQEGGAMAPAQAAPAQGGQDIQTQVMQLVQAAMSGDEQATQAIQQIMQAAQQGDQQAAQIAQMIQEVAQQMQGQAQAAKRGAKISYLHSLKTGCPEGYEVSYHKVGGKVCKECVAKNQTKESTELHKEGGDLKKKLCNGKKLQEGAKVTEEKCGGKAKKHQIGGFLEKAAQFVPVVSNVVNAYNSYKNGEGIKNVTAAALGAQPTPKKVNMAGSPRPIQGPKRLGYDNNVFNGGALPEVTVTPQGNKVASINKQGGSLTLDALQTAYKSLNA